ncbi:MAG: hypothetical protein Q8N71_02210 [candidate division Zixibacteria bacterium]|nr:hypothetical protein [candidate division Zixibacteria bacterium]
MRVENNPGKGESASGGSPLQLVSLILKWVILFTLMIFFLSCGLKRPKDEIGPLKEVMSRFERGVISENRAVLDSVYSKKGINRDSLISALFLELSPLKSKGSFSFVRRKFSVIEDKKMATVELFIGGKEQKEEKILEILLKKRKGRWEIVGQNIK